MKHYLSILKKTTLLLNETPEKAIRHYIYQIQANVMAVLAMKGYPIDFDENAHFQEYSVPVQYVKDALGEVFPLIFDLNHRRVELNLLSDYLSSDEPIHNMKSSANETIEESMERILKSSLVSSVLSPSSSNTAESQVANHVQEPTDEADTEESVKETRDESKETESEQTLIIDEIKDEIAEDDENEEIEEVDEIEEEIDEEVEEIDESDDEIEIDDETEEEISVPQTANQETYEKITLQPGTVMEEKNGEKEEETEDDIDDDIDEPELIDEDNDEDITEEKEEIADDKEDEEDLTDEDDSASYMSDEAQDESDKESAVQPVDMLSKMFGETHYESVSTTETNLTYGKDYLGVPPKQEQETKMEFIEHETSGNSKRKIETQKKTDAERSVEPREKVDSKRKVVSMEINKPRRYNEKIEEKKNVEPNIEVQNEFKPCLHKNDLTFVYDYITVSTGGRVEEAELIIYPLHKEGNDIVVWCLFNGNSTVRYSGEKSQVLVPLLNTRVVVSGQFVDGHFFTQVKLPKKDKARGDVLKVDEDPRNGTEGHIASYDNENGIEVHVFPTTFKNNQTQNADYFYYVKVNDEIYTGDTSVNPFVYIQTESHNLEVLARWEESKELIGLYVQDNSDN